MAQPHTTQLSQLAPATGPAVGLRELHYVRAVLESADGKKKMDWRKEERGKKQSSCCNVTLVRLPWSLLLLIPLFDICLGRTTRRHKTCILHITPVNPPGLSPPQSYPSPSSHLCCYHSSICHLSQPERFCPRSTRIR